MWIEIFNKCGMSQPLLVNFDNISMAKATNKIFILWSPEDNVIYDYEFANQSDADAFYQGLILALNGLDFVSELGYIKPLLQSRNESLYQYIKLKEVLGERSR